MGTSLRNHLERVVPAGDFLVDGGVGSERIAVLIDVAEFDGEWRPKKYREYIRATGPSVRPDLGKQAGQ